MRNRAAGQLCDALGCSPPLVQLGAAEPRAQRGGGPLRDFRIHDLNGPQAGVGEEGFRVFFSLKIF